MSTLLNVRVPRPNRRSLIGAGIAVVLIIALVFAGYKAYRAIFYNTVTAYFSQVLALYPGDKVLIMGVPVGTVDSITPAGDKMRVELSYESKYHLPKDVKAAILNPSLVSSRTVQFFPPYTGGDTLPNGASLGVDRTQVPVEWDQLRDSLTRLLTDLGPTKQQPRGPIGDVIESLADGLAGKGQQVNDALSGLSDALSTLNQGRGDLFGVVKSLALFITALSKSDRQIVALNNNFAKITTAFTNTDSEVATALKEFNQLLATTRPFLDKNAGVLTKDVDNLAEATNAILQPVPKDGLENGLHAFPNLAANLVNIFPPSQGGLRALPVINNFSNPMQFLCSAIQSGSRLGYQESAELCAQYLGPILDAIKFNALPFGLNLFDTGVTLPKQIAYSEPRLQPPPGYKDTTVPGIFSRDTLFSHGNHEPGWVAAPGMQGVEVQPFTENMLTPDSLAALLGGPDAAIPDAPPAFGVANGRLPGPPNAYSENTPLPPPWYPQPGPPPAPAPGVIPGDPGGAPAISPASLPAEAGGN